MSRRLAALLLLAATTKSTLLRAAELSISQVLATPQGQILLRSLALPVEPVAEVVVLLRGLAVVVVQGVFTTLQAFRRLLEQKPSLLAAAVLVGLLDKTGVLVAATPQ